MVSVGEGFEEGISLSDFCPSLRILEWNSLFGVVWMCIPKRAEVAHTRGTLQCLASMTIGRLNAIKPSEQVDRIDMVELITTDGIVRCVTRSLVRA